MNLKKKNQEDEEVVSSLLQRGAYDLWRQVEGLAREILPPNTHYYTESKLRLVQNELQLRAFLHAAYHVGASMTSKTRTSSPRPSETSTEVDQKHDQEIDDAETFTGGRGISSGGDYHGVDEQDRSSIEERQQERSTTSRTTLQLAGVFLRSDMVQELLLREEDDKDDMSSNSSSPVEEISSEEWAQRMLQMLKVFFF